MEYSALFKFFLCWYNRKKYRSTVRKGRIPYVHTQGKIRSADSVVQHLEPGYRLHHGCPVFAALAQSSPGAIAVNAAILVGWRVGGFIGMVTSVIGTIIPPMAILSGISFFYTVFATNFYVSLALKGMQAGVAAVILDVVFGLGGNIIRQLILRHPGTVGNQTRKAPIRSQARCGCMP